MAIIVFLRMDPEIYQHPLTVILVFKLIIIIIVASMVIPPVRTVIKILIIYITIMEIKINTVVLCSTSNLAFILCKILL